MVYHSEVKTKRWLCRKRKWKTQGTTFSSEIPPHERSTCSEVIPSFHHYSQNCYQSEHLYIQRKGRKVSQGHPKPGIRGKSYLEVDIFQVLASHESADSVAADGKRDFVAYSHSNPKKCHFTTSPAKINPKNRTHTWMFCPEVLTKLLSREIPAIPWFIFPFWLFINSFERSFYLFTSMLDLYSLFPHFLYIYFKYFR